MTDPMRMRNVVVAVIYDEAHETFLLWHNPKRREYAFPMKQIPEGATNREALAVQALSDADYPVGTRPRVESLDRERISLVSPAAGAVTGYDYHVMKVEPENLASPEALHPDLRYYPYGELIAAVNVTDSTQKICRFLVEERHVTLAIISRRHQGERQVLLVNKPNYGFFFPAKRIKSTLRPAEVLPDLLHDDLGYEAAFKVTGQTIVEDMQPSQRFGDRNVAFRFYAHAVQTTWDEEPGQPEKWAELLASHVAGQVAGGNWPADQQYYRWVGLDALKTDSQLSRSVDLMRLQIMQMLEASP